MPIENLLVYLGVLPPPNKLHVFVKTTPNRKMFAREIPPSRFPPQKKKEKRLEPQQQQQQQQQQPQQQPTDPHKITIFKIQLI